MNAYNNSLKKKVVCLKYFVCYFIYFILKCKTADKEQMIKHIDIFSNTTLSCQLPKLQMCNLA